ncbi:MAG: hypothetical protein ACRD1I_07410 [Terriglobia bacterium]
MSLRKSPQKTPAFLAACRANAKKSTGPKTVRTKARTRLNSLKHGRYATAFRNKLVRLGSKEALRVYDALLAAAVKRLCVNSLHELGVAKRLARQDWCVWWRAQQATTTLAKQRAAAQSMNFPVLNAKLHPSPLVAHNGPDLPPSLRKLEPAIRRRTFVSPIAFFRADD